MIKICAVIAARNEASYLSYLLPRLASQDIDVFMIDHESNDESPSIYKKHRNNPIIGIESLNFDGVFSLTDQITLKDKVMKSLQHDWFVHHDADEVMEHADRGGLRYAIEEAHTQGFNVLNFNEYVFIPEPGQTYEGKDYYELMQRYYYFRGSPKSALHRAFERSLCAKSLQSAGHRIKDDKLRISPLDHVLRHYIVLSQRHAIKKYGSRIFSQTELDKGWHKRRNMATADSLQLPVVSNYFCDIQKDGLLREKTATEHYWQWNA